MNIKAKKMISFAFGIQFIQILFPIILIPLYTSKLGISQYGELIIYISIANLLKIVSDYSYGIIGPLQVAKKKNDNLSDFISMSMSTKFVLGILTSIVSLLLFSFYNTVEGNLILLISVSLLTLFKSLNTYWIFLGLKKTQDFFFILLTTRLIAISILLVSLSLYPTIWISIVILAFDDLILFFCSIIVLRYRNGLKLKIYLTKSLFIAEIKSGYQYFISNFLSTSINFINVLFLGNYLNSSEVGIFSIAEKIIIWVKHIYGIFNQALFPYLIELKFSNKIILLNSSLKNYLIFLIFSTIIGSFFLYFYGNTIISLLNSSDHFEILSYLRILIFVPIIYCFSQKPYLNMLLQERKKEFVKVYFIAFTFALIGLITIGYFSIWSVILSIYLYTISLTISFNLIDRKLLVISH